MEIYFKIRKENNSQEKIWNEIEQENKNFDIKKLQKKCNSKNKYPYNCMSKELPDEYLVKGIKEVWQIDPQRKNAKPQYKYEVSNYGRVRMADSKEILVQIDSPDYGKGWLVLEKYPSVFVYHLVAEAWLEYPEGNRWQVHHIDNDGYNNRVDNLIYVTPEIHYSIHHPREL